MSRRGEGIRKRADGRWEGRYTVIICSERKSKSVYARSYAEVKKKLQIAREKEQEISSQKDLNVRMILFQEVAVEWLEYIKKERKYSTLVKYQGIYGKYLSVLDPCKLCELNREDADKIFAHFDGLKSKQLQKSVLCTLNQILRYAGAKYEIQLPEYSQNIKIEQKKVEIFSRNEQIRLVQYLHEGETDIYKTGIFLCLCTGLRLGELCSLKWTDIDSDTKSLHVSSTVQRIAVTGHATKTILYESEPKSKCSLREIPLSDELLFRLEKYRGSGLYVIKGSSPAEPRTYQNKLKKYLREAGISSKNFHVLRHTFATNCIESGMDVKSLSEILGHTDVKITLNRYVHPSMDKKRQYLNHLTAIYGQNGGQTS